MTDDAYARLIQNASAASGASEGAPTFAGSVNGRQPYPLDKWNPSNCGFVDISIDRDGRWFHEGSEIKRQELVSLFAGLLRREEDGGYYLVTPVEKVEVDVALHPLMVVDAAPMVAEEGRYWHSCSTPAVFFNWMPKLACSPRIGPRVRLT